MPTPPSAPVTVQAVVDATGFEVPGLGRPAQWPTALRMMFGMMLDTQQPMSLVWGDERRLLYNEAYVQFLGEKHPAAFGQKLDQVWAEIWDDIGPLVDRARAGEALHLQDVPLAIQRGGRLTRAWFTFFFAPARNEDRSLCGMYSSVLETTSRVLIERRQSLLLDFSDQLEQLEQPDDVLCAATRLLATYLEAGDAFILQPGCEHGQDWSVNEVVGTGRLPQSLDSAALPEALRTLSISHDVVQSPASGLVAGPDDVGPDDVLLAVSVTPPGGSTSALAFICPQARAADDIDFVREVARRATAAIRQLLGVVELRRLTETLEVRVAERTAELERARRDALHVAERLQLSLDAAQLGEWDLDLTTDESHRSLRHDQCFGYDKPIPDWGFEKFIQHVHPEDREFVAQAFHNALDRVDEWDFECRVIWPDGSLHWIGAHGTVYDIDGRPSRMAGIVMDITARKLAEQELRNASRRKDEFLAMLAHELRNPLAPIGTAAQLLQMAPDDHDRVRTSSQIIMRQVSHITDLVDDLLDVSRVTRGLVKLDRVPLDLRTVVAAAVEQTRPLIESRGHALEVQTGADTLPVLGDRTRLIQVIANLLNNAAKYTPKGGRIGLDVGLRGDAVQVQVSDNGSGIAPSLLPVIFDLFTQAERTPDRSQGGLGIGLSLVRSIVQLHGGSVTAASSGPGCGSTFLVSLPLHTAEIEPAPATHAPTGAVPVHGLQVLIVDDNEDAATTMADLLRLQGHDALVAHTGRQALELGRAHAFDAYILDVGLPDMTGYELAGSLRAQGAGDAVFIAATGYGQSQDRELSRAAGFDHHLVKPVDSAELLDLLRAPA
ncbi:ATP-binding protein [Lysobacter korlensis]|uniref:histidine kinase n=1 Tax=Lysobacter korlensis TaxID=553636 RepID=A0ABV6RSA3_9GAMM